MNPDNMKYRGAQQCANIVTDGKKRFDGNRGYFDSLIVSDIF